MTYLDAASAAPLHPAAREVWQAALDDGWADPARLYGEGRLARILLDGARETVAAAVGVRRDEVAFCASGTQSVHAALLGGLAGRRRTGRHLVVSAVEHSSVLHTAEAHEADGGSVTRVPVDRTGRVDATEFAAALGADTALASLQSANHEVGTTQPVGEVAATCRERGVPLHVDAAQSLGRLPVDEGWSLLSGSAHKWGGPPGVGVLAVRKGVRWRAPWPADEREGGRVPGFGNLPAVLAAAAALDAVRAGAAAEGERQSRLVARLRDELPRRVPDVEVVGDPVRRLPHVVTFSCLYVGGEALLLALDEAGFSVSSGSSCSSSTLAPSHVLAAMGVLTQGNVRLSLHPGVTDDDVERFLDVLPPIVTRLRGIVGAEGL